MRSIKTHNLRQLLKSGAWCLPMLSMLALTTLATTRLTTLPSSADSNDASVSVGSGCSLTSELVSNHTLDNLINGTYRSDIGTTIISSVCNETADTKVYAYGFNGEVDVSTGNDIINTNLTSLVPSSSGIYPIISGNINFPGESNISTLSDSAWFMKLTGISGTYPFTMNSDYTTYHSIPSTSTLIASYVPTSSIHTKSSFSTTYAVYASTTQPAGTYVGGVKYTLTHTSPSRLYSYNITLNANGGVFSNDSTNPTATTKSLTGEAWANSTITLTTSSTTPTRENYIFQGWCNTSTTSDGTLCNNSTTPTYDTDDDITITGDVTTTLYGVWKSDAAITTITYMQDITSENKADIAKSMVANRQYQLIDNRDNKKYYLSKLETSKDAPGNPIEENGKYYQIWMTQNLDLCIGCTGTAALTSENTDLNVSGEGMYSSGYSKDAKGVITWSPVSTAITSNSTTPATGTGGVNGVQGVTGWGNSDRIPYSAEGGSTYVITNGTNAADTVTTSCNAGNDSDGNPICPHYLRGDFYNWPAAIATNDTGAFTTNYTEADNSICPVGWQLPNGILAKGTYSDADYILKIYGVVTDLAGENVKATWATNGFAKARIAPLYLVRSGQVMPGQVQYSGYSVNLWAGSVYSESYAYCIMLGDPWTGAVEAYPSLYGWRRTGKGVRCIVR